MIPEVSPRAAELATQIQAFMDEHVYPNEKLYEQQLHEDPAQPFRMPPILEAHKAKAKAQGL